MDRLLDLERAARLAGVGIDEIEAEIRRGVLHLVRGKVRLAELKRQFPDVGERRTTMVEVVGQIREDATSKAMGQRNRQTYGASYAELKESFDRAARDARYYRDQVIEYRELCTRMRGMVQDLRTRVTPRERAFTDAILRWIDKRLAHLR